MHSSGIDPRENSSHCRSQAELRVKLRLSDHSRTPYAQMAGRIRKKSACPKMDSPEIAVADDVIHRTWRLPQPPKAASHNCPFRSGTLPVMKLPWVVAALVLTALSFGVPAQVASTTYWLLLKQDGHTWCGYADMAEFTSDVKNRTPTESARATYASDKLIEVTYQVAPESGDWVVVDKYTPANDQLIGRPTIARC